MASTAKISNNPEVRELVKYAEDHGFEASRTGGNHIRLLHQYVKEVPPVFLPSTPSDHASMKNSRAEVRRAINLASAILIERPNRAGLEDLPPSLRDILTEALDSAVAEQSYVYECPACRGRGRTRVFTHPIGLARHMQSEHPEPELEVESEPEPEEQEMDEKDVKRVVPQVDAAAVEEVLRDTDDGEELTVEDIRRAVSERVGYTVHVEHAVHALKKRRSKYPKLEPKAHGVYYVRHAPPKPEAPAPQLAASHGQQRIFEEIGHDFQGNPIVRDHEGGLWIMDLRPL